MTSNISLLASSPFTASEARHERTCERARGGGKKSFPRPGFPILSLPLARVLLSRDLSRLPQWRAYSHAIPTAYTPFQILMLYVVSLCSKLTNRALFSNSLNICTGRRRLLLYSNLVHQLVSTRNTCLGSKKILPLRRSLH